MLCFLFVKNAFRNHVMGARSVHYHKDITVSGSFEQIVRKSADGARRAFSFSQLQGAPLPGCIRVHAILHHLGFSQLFAITNHVVMKNLVHMYSLKPILMANSSKWNYQLKDKKAYLSDICQEGCIDLHSHKQLWECLFPRAFPTERVLLLLRFFFFFFCHSLRW